MSNIIVWIVGAFALLLGWLGIERHKGKQKDKVIVQQAQEIKKERKQGDIYKVSQEAVIEASAKTEEIQAEQKVTEEKIEEAKTDEEIINIANDIVSGFNARH